MTQTSHKTDREIQSDVTSELAGMPGLDTAGVDVSVKSGILTLSGQVGSAKDRLTAKRTVARMAGVRALVDRLVIGDPGAPGAGTDDDAHLAELANRMLASADDVAAKSVRADVRGRVITLSGEVNSQHQRAAASQAVKHLRGVVGLTDDIHVASPDTPGAK